jgi:hypothetical protein
MSIEEDFRFDVRIQERMLQKGLVKEDELKTRLDSLVDVEGQSEPLDLQQPGLAPEKAESDGEKEGQ